MSVAASHMPTSRSAHPSSADPSKRPATINELAEQALEGLWDDSKELKHYLRVAEKYRREGKESLDRGDLEPAFIAFARAATLVLEKLPNHRDYKAVLNAGQRQNLSLNGQDILDNLSNIKMILVERYEKWKEHHPQETEAGSTKDCPRPDDPQPRTSQVDPSRASDDGPQRFNGGAARERRSIVDDNWIYTEPEIQRVSRTQSILDRRSQAAIAAAKQAAGRNQDRVGPDYAFSRAPVGVGVPDFQAQQEEMRRREEMILKRREQKRRQEQDGILRRQQEAESAAQSVRHIYNTSAPQAPPSLNMGLGSSTSIVYQLPQRSSTPTPSPSTYHPPSSFTAPLGPSYSEPLIGSDPYAPSRLPLETPSRYEGDSTDSESVHSGMDWRAKRQHPDIHHHSLVNRSSFPPPITTTSPPPAETGPIQYPMLMSQHQKRQGYQPSLNSMFVSEAIPQQSSSLSSLLLFNEKTSNQGLYTTDNLPPVSMPSAANHLYNVQQQSHTMAYRASPQTPQPEFYAPTRPAPPVPGPSPAPPPISAPPPESERIARSSRPVDASPILKIVILPRECLPRFLTIAKVNTELNRETCGLLLGKPKGNKYHVTTLLIPRQHSTSDTCTMDEEELVLQFTEERSLITLGWIHTHPSQSCFMSSVDLHTHSGFQRMLPESFAVVCAPKYNPNFGIFRLTDPPGLQAILDCTAKEAFHPHPDLPIYTDADKGHVHMKDGISMEIVDLR